MWKDYKYFLVQSLKHSTDMTVEHNTSAFNLWKYKMKSYTFYVQAYLYKTINCNCYWVLWHSQKYQLSTVIVSTSECAKKQTNKKANNTN